MRTIWRLLVLMIWCAGCDINGGQRFVPPSAVPALSANNHLAVARYAAILTASSSCAETLPAEARARAYQVDLFEGGVLVWTSPTLNPPPGHPVFSSGTLDGDTFSFSISTSADWDLQDQSDSFHGLWDTLSGTGYLNIAGKGVGRSGRTGITGTLAGLFTYYDGTRAAYCQAADHRFAFAKQ